MAMEFSFTKHSLRRYVERFDTSLNIDEARIVLHQKVKNVSLLKERTWSGDEKWLLRNPDCVLITRRDKKINKIVCVTLVAPTNSSNEIPAHEMDIIREWRESSGLHNSIEEIEKESIEIIGQLELSDDLKKINLTRGQVQELQHRIIKNEERAEEKKKLIFDKYIEYKYNEKQSEIDSLRNIIFLLQKEISDSVYYLENNATESAVKKLQRCLSKDWDADNRIDGIW